MGTIFFLAIMAGAAYLVYKAVIDSPKDMSAGSRKSEAIESHVSNAQCASGAYRTQQVAGNRRKEDNDNKFNLPSAYWFGVEIAMPF